ncbi:MAG TPA: hypothetical protein VK729_06950 [Silvibacterium sp.]|nr:hypothetical protein [Silvibacterium sp.]
MSEHRHIRLQSTSHLSGVLWCVLIIGGAVTIASSCMFGADSTWLHGLQVFAFSLLIALALVAVADINRPFQGSVHVHDAAFRRAQSNMKEQ